MNACPYFANSFSHHRPRFIDSIGATSILTRGAAKYRNPKSGATWSGKGRAPAWLANVKNRARVLIDEEGGSSDAGVAAKAAHKASAKKANASKKGTSKLAAKNPSAKDSLAKKATALKREAKGATSKKPEVLGEKVAAKKSGPAAKKRVVKKAAVTSNSTKTSNVTDTVSDTQAGVEAREV
ncbi:H-NS family nucleoid-associated regulatory protein [Caballeronia sordidicola]|uniref:H-NS family nucleoid-associated regulatory protein n=1 Tax=Caballeronia sordidicola TaxID=196367 RepID=UPI00211A2CEA|nr:H-NS family nucleoid-associated regulatory protein [Caballeronia sordidicola]